MLSSDEKIILQELSQSNPLAYKLFMKREDEYFNTIKLGCHELRNKVALISSILQLLNLTNPELSDLPRWNHLNTDVKELVQAFTDISVYRYADKVSCEETPLSTIVSQIYDTIKNTYPDIHNLINLTINSKSIASQEFNSLDNMYINTDITRLVKAVSCLIDNAVNASYGLIKLSGINSVTPIEVNIVYTTYDDDISQISHLDISVNNIGDGPDEQMLPVMFLPFRSSDPNRIGLGLSIAHEIVDALNGKLYYEQRENICSFNISF